MAEIARDVKGAPMPLSQEATYVLDECRMILPGIQALFGFQLVAVFNHVFWERLSYLEQIFHLVAIALIAVAVALVMTPAAYHRQVERESISHDFIRLASRLLLLSMAPLVLGICLDFYLIAKLIVDDVPLSVTFSVVLLGVFLTLWVLLPRVVVLQDLMRGRSATHKRK
jgi:hypothetical protein